MGAARERPPYLPPPSRAWTFSAGAARRGGRAALHLVTNGVCMKVICDRSALLEAVNTVGSVVPTRSPSPALSCVKLTAAKAGSVGSLSLAGTDAEVSIALGLNKVDVVQAGVAVVSADRLRAII